MLVLTTCAANSASIKERRTITYLLSVIREARLKSVQKFYNKSHTLKNEDFIYQRKYYDSNGIM